MQIACYGCIMPILQIKNLSPDVVRTLKVRAAAEGKSLQSYMHDTVSELARRPTRRELLTRIQQRTADNPLPHNNLTRDFVLAALREDRESH